MKICRSLDLYGPRPTLEKLLSSIKRARPGHWRSEGPADGGLHILSRPDRGAKLLLLIGFASPERLMLANIHPTNDWPGDFTIDDYNQIATAFAASIQPAADRLGLILELGPAERTIDEMICAPTCQALHQFVHAIENEAPAPEMYWFRFLSLIHLERALLRPPEFAEFLKTKGWAQPEADHWAADFSRCLSLLDMQHSVQRSVRVVSLAGLPTASQSIQ